MSLKNFTTLREKTFRRLQIKTRETSDWFKCSCVPRNSSTPSASESSLRQWDGTGEGQVWDEPGIPKVWVDGQWERGEEIARGGYGTVFEARHTTTGRLTALKVEEVRDEIDEGAGVMREVEVYEKLARGLPNVSGFSELHDYGSNGRYRFLLMDRMGPNVFQVARAKGLSIRHMLIFALQAVNRIEMLHRTGFVHCDIKPTNFVVGRRDPSRIYLIDFGLSEPYLDADDKHVQKVKAKFTGTAEFASPNVLGGWKPSRTDDLISLAYSVVYLAGRTLPWINDGIEETENVIENKEEKVEAEEEDEIVAAPAGRKKTSTSTHEGGKWKRRWIAKQQAQVGLGELCKKVPMMEEFLRYLLKVKFEERPNYNYLRVLLKKSLDEIEAERRREKDAGM